MELDDAETLGPVASLDYYDRRSVTLPMAVTPLEAWNLIMADPQPGLALAFRVRDAISALFGVRRIGGFSGRARASVEVGETLDFFTVEGVGPDRLVLTARDRHLDVMTCVSSAGTRLAVTSSVVTHNLFGRAYMVPVGIAHRLIVNRMLRRLKRRLAERA
jgi:hypothetical protein